MSSFPADWANTKLGKVAKEMFGGGTPSTKNPSFWQGNIPWLTSKSLGDSIYLTAGEKTISEEAVRKSATHIVPAGNLIFATRVGVGKVVVTKIDVAISQDSTGIVVDPTEVDPTFLAYQLRTDSVQRFVEQNKRGATIQGITRTSLQQVEVVIPPLPEQRRIARVLSTVQSAIEQQARLIALTRELKSALMHKLFTEGLRGEKQKQTEIGPVPESWDVVELGNCATIQTGTAKGRLIGEDESLELPYLRVANVQDGFLNLAEIKTIVIRAKERERYLLRKGDVVLTEGGDFDKLGRGFIWQGQVENCIHQNHIFAVRVNPNKLLSEFFAYQSQSPYGKRYFLSVAHKTSNLACINSAKLKRFPVLIPNINDQKQIAHILQTIDRKLSNQTRKRDLLEELFRTLLHQLMTGQVRVGALTLGPSPVATGEGCAEAPSPSAGRRLG